MFSDVLLIGCDLLQTQTAAQEKCKQGSCKPNLSPIVPVKGPNARPTFAGAGMDLLPYTNLRCSMRFSVDICGLVSASRILLQTSNLLPSCLLALLTDSCFWNRKNAALLRWMCKGHWALLASAAHHTALDVQDPLHTSLRHTVAKSMYIP